MPGAFELLQAHSPWIAIPLALLPAALNLWWTHRLPTGDDTALPERYMALAQRVSATTTSCAIGIGLFAGWQALWMVPLQIVALVCTNHRTRQRLFGETWPLHRYLLWRLRMFGGVWAYWVCLALTPALIVYTSRPHRWWAAAAAFVVLALWNRWYMRVLLFVLGATRLTRADLDERFQHVFRRAHVAAPEIWRVGCEGGRLMNALALPSLTGNGVLFFDRLLERLSVEEITAILAHEVAHLEHYTPRLRRLWLMGLGAIALLVFAGAMGDVIWIEVPSWLPVLSIAAVVGGLALRAQRLRPKETEADLRAVDLCENPEALVSGLTHVYTANHIPRRWSARTEARATHPSLAKRLADIRRHARTTEPLPAAERIVVASPEPGRWALIENDRLTFLWTGLDETAAGSDLVERAQRLERLAFADLSELRLAAGRGGSLALAAMDRRGRRFSLAVYERDAAELQAALDRVDHLIVAAQRGSRRVHIGERLTAIVALMMSSAVGGFAAVMVPALLMLRRPTRRLMTALAIALIGTAVAVAANGNDTYVEMLVLAALAALALWEARTAHHDETTADATAWQWIEPLAFTLPVVLGVALIAVDTRDLFDLHVAIRDRAWFAASTMALAAFWWLSPAAHSRRIASCVTVVAVAAVVVSCPWFLTSVVRDDLVASMPILEGRTVSLKTDSKQTVDGRFDSVSLAPDGDTFLLAADAEDDDAETEDELESPRRYLVGASSGWSRSFEALQAVLVDGNRVLALERTSEGSRLRVDDARTGRETWTLPIPSNDVWLIQAAPDGRWRALQRHGRKLTRTDGRVGSSDARDTTWTIAAGEGYADARVGEGPFALGVGSTWRRALMSWPYEDWRTTTRLVRADVENQAEIATSRLGVECPMTPIGVDTIVCVSFDGRWSRFWRFDSGSGRLSAAGQRHGRLWGTRQITPTLLAARAGYQSILIALDARTSTTLLHSWVGCGVNDVAVAAGTIAMACARSGKTDVSFYRMPKSVHQDAAVGDQRRAVDEVGAR